MSSKYQNKIFQLDDVTKYKYKGYKYHTNILKTQIPTCPLPAGSLGDAVAGFQSGGGGEAEEDDGGKPSHSQVIDNDDEGHNEYHYHHISSSSPLERPKSK